MEVVAEEEMKMEETLIAMVTNFCIGKNIRIHHECEGGIGKSITRITNWHHDAWGVMPNCDGEEWNFLSHPQTNNGLFFLLTTKYRILYWKKMKKASRIS